VTLFGRALEDAELPGGHGVVDLLPGETKGDEVTEASEHLDRGVLASGHGAMVVLSRVRTGERRTRGCSTPRLHSCRPKLSSRRTSPLIGVGGIA
jgi:hypothetical protein